MSFAKNFVQPNAHAIKHICTPIACALFMLLILHMLLLCVLQQAYQEAMKGFIDTGGSSIKDRGHGISLNRDDRVHGSLLITTELFMNCILKAEVGGLNLKSALFGNVMLCKLYLKAMCVFISCCGQSSCT